jgi:hypothetical protein
MLASASTRGVLDRSREEEELVGPGGDGGLGSGGVRTARGSGLKLGAGGIGRPRFDREEVGLQEVGLVEGRWLCG